MDSPGIYTLAQREGWRLVADAVRAEQGRMFMQLWHMGRMVLPDYIGGQLPLAPSAVASDAEVRNAEGVKKQLVVPKAMTLAEIQQTVKDFALAARSAIDAGMDGVEIHAANGFLIDQFIRSSTNLRQDEYGGDVQKRARFLFEVLDAVW